MPKAKPTIITATEMQKKSGEIIRRAHKEGEHFIVERDGYPVVAIIPIDDYRRPPVSGQHRSRGVVG